jgi:hypothetical protein
MTKTMAFFRKVTKVSNKKGTIFDATNDCDRSKQAQRNVKNKKQNCKWGLKINEIWDSQNGVIAGSGPTGMDGRTVPF